MRLVLPFLIVVLGGAALMARPHPGLPESRRQAKGVSYDAAVTAAAEQAVPAPVSPAALPLPPAPVRGSSATFEAPSASVSGVDGPQALLGALARLLSLSPLQKAQIEEILWERAKSVDAYQQEVARRGWAKLSDFDLRIAEIRDLAHRRVMSLLTSAQAAEYGRVVALGIPEDHLSIELPENVVQLD